MKILINFFLSSHGQEIIENTNLEAKFTWSELQR